MIKKLFISSSIRSIKNMFPDYNEEMIEKIQYGLEAVYLSLTKVVVILLLSLILNIFVETVIVLLLFNLLRMTGFGLHASKSWACWITSLPAFVGIPYICKYISFSNNVLYVIAFISLINFILFAPADTIKRPLIRKKRRIIYKCLTIVIGCGYIALMMISKNQFLTSALAFSMLIEAILICPATYILFKLPYNNYKRYQNGV